MTDIDKRPLGMQINILSNLFRQAVAEEARQKGIPCSYFPIIRYLKMNEQKNITQSDICDFLHFKPSSISVTLQSMENEGLLTRFKSPDDNRKTYVKLSEKGQESDRKIRLSYSKIEDYMKSLVNDDVETFKKCLVVLINALEEGGEVNG